MTLTPGTKLGPYEILSPIGAGGMGEVYKARDTRLGRIVAIKKVKEQHSERFKQEARSIAALNHSFICQLHDIGPDYLVLEYVEGKPLSSPLPEKEAVRLAIQIATALEEAHRNGVIHRDLKPSNIMVTDKGSVKLLDFGLAKLYEQDAAISTSPTADFPATQAGAVLGTIAYMSPEQAQGQPAEARSDIFSFGLVLYEMLSGRRAFAGDSNYAVMNAIVKEDPPPLQASLAVEKTVRQCLAKKPSGRYQTMSEVKSALEQAFAEKSRVSSVEPQPSIAVLPFVNMSGDKEQEYFSDGLAEEIINALTQIHGLKVIARTSSFSFRGKEADIAQIRDRLKVQNILEGSVRKSGNRIRVTAQLIDTADESHLWSERYDREMTDVFAIQDEISKAISKKLRGRLAEDRSQVRRHTDNVEAYSLYLKGRYHQLRAGPEGAAKSKEYFEQAIAADSKYALPWFGLSIFYWSLGYLDAMPQRAANSQSRQSIGKALEIDELLPEAHGVVGMLQASEFDWKGAEQEFLRALELGPEAWDVWMQYSGFYLMPMHRFDEAVTAMQKALELDPMSPLLQRNLGGLYSSVGQYDRAIGKLQSVLDLEPHFPEVHSGLGLAYLHKGNLSDAIQAYEKNAELMKRSPRSLGSLGMAYARAGRIAEAKDILKELREVAQNRFVPAGAYALIYLGLAEIDHSFDWLEKAIEEQDLRTIYALLGPLTDPLRSHPRYRALLRKMNLADLPEVPAL